MKVYCTNCKTNYTELPDDAQRGPGFRFACSACRVEEFLPQIKTIARSFGRVYGLNLKDCIQEGALALLKEEKKGKTLTKREVYGCVRRAMSRLKERERAEQGQARPPETDPILDPPEKQLLRYARIDPKTGERRECEEWREGKRAGKHGKKKVGEPHFQRWAFDPQLNAGTDKGATGAIADSPDPEERAIAQDLQSKVKVAIQELTPLQQKTLYLLNDKDLSIREAASVLGISKSEVSRISAEAKAAIIKKLGTKTKIAPIDISKDVRQSEQKLAA